MTKMLNLTAKNQMNLNKIKGEAITENLKKNWSLIQKIWSATVYLLVNMLSLLWLNQLDIYIFPYWQIALLSQSCQMINRNLYTETLWVTSEPKCL